MPEVKKKEGDFLLVLSALNKEETARKIAQLLVKEKLAACVSVSAPVYSTYSWQGNIESEKEWLLLVKTQAGNWAEVEKTVRRHHPYQVPEIIALPIVQGHQPYLDWLKENSRQAEEKI
jgi:periplasmic divalent cation tolerance protein